MRFLLQLHNMVMSAAQSEMPPRAHAHTLRLTIAEDFLAERKKKIWTAAYITTNACKYAVNNNLSTLTQF